jgi:6-phosphogluconolactonase (cycloisomerase 2 family)
MKRTVSWRNKFFSVGMIIFLTLFIAACGSGGWGSVPPPHPSGTSPTITSADNTIFTVGTAGTFTVTATGDPAPTFALTGTLPTGVTFDTTTGVLSGTLATGTNGTYPLTITASNGVSPDATQTFTLTVAKFVTLGKYVYVNNDADTNYVSAFSINTDGTLTELTGSPYATGGAGYNGYYAANKIALAPVKKLLFASNAADNTITVFSINQTDGTLTLVGTPVASGGTMSSGGSLAVDINENYLFAGNFGEQSIAVFAISTGGGLTPVTGSPFNIGENADGITMNPAGNILYAIRPTLAVLSVATDGSLSHISGSPFAISGTSLAFGSSTMLFSAEVGGVLSSYAIDASGAPTLLNTLSIGGNAQAVTATRNGSLAILSGGGGNQISVVNVAADGTLTQVAGSPFTTAAGMYGYALANPSGTFLYATEITQIEGFSIGADGALTSLGTFPLTNPGYARSLVIY